MKVPLQLVCAHAPRDLRCQHRMTTSSTKRVAFCYTTKKPLCGHFGMANFNHERVHHALNELLVRIVPDDPEEDEDTANQRFEEAFEFAFKELESAEEPAVVPDLNHVTGLIDEKCKGFGCASQSYVNCSSIQRHRRPV